MKTKIKIDWENQLIFWKITEMDFDIWKELMKLRKQYKLIIPFEIINLGEGYYGVKFRRFEDENNTY